MDPEALRRKFESLGERKVIRRVGDAVRVSDARGKLFAEAIKGPVLSEGFCYLLVVRRIHHDLVRSLLGQYPTLAQVASLPEDYFLSNEALEACAVQLVGRRLHVVHKGIHRHFYCLPNIRDYLAAVYQLDGASYGHLQRIVAEVRPIRFVGDLLASVVGGATPVYGVVVDTSSVETVSEPVALSTVDCEGGYSYLRLVKPSLARGVREVLGHGPTLEQVMALPDFVFLNQRELSECLVHFSKNRVYVKSQGASKVKGDLDFSFVARLSKVGRADQLPPFSRLVFGTVGSAELLWYEQFGDLLCGKVVARTGPSDEVTVKELDRLELEIPGYVARGGQVQQSQGFCYRRFLREEFAQRVVSWLGPYPTVGLLLSMPSAVFLHSSALHEVNVVARGGCLHVVDEVVADERVWTLLDFIQYAVKYGGSGYEALDRYLIGRQDTYFDGSEGFLEWKIGGDPRGDAGRSDILDLPERECLCAKVVVVVQNKQVWGLHGGALLYLTPKEVTYLSAGTSSMAGNSLCGSQACGALSSQAAMIRGKALSFAKVFGAVMYVASSCRSLLFGSGLNGDFVRLGIPEVGQVFPGERGSLIGMSVGGMESAIEVDRGKARFPMGLTVCVVGDVDAMQLVLDKLGEAVLRDKCVDVVLVSDLWDKRVKVGPLWLYDPKGPVEESVLVEVSELCMKYWMDGMLRG